MGYRNYIGKIPKREYNKIKKMSRLELFQYKNPGKEVDEDDLYIGFYDLVSELHNFGKYVEFGEEKFYKPFFKNKETFKYYDSDQECYIVQKEFLQHIIEWFSQQNSTYFNEMIDPFFKDGNKFLNSVKTEYNRPNNKHTFDFNLITEEEQTAMFKMIEYIRSIRVEWTQLSPYNLDSGDEVTTSWKYEYVIFELVRIYKTFDWKKDIMVWYGW